MIQWYIFAALFSRVNLSMGTATQEYNYLYIWEQAVKLTKLVSFGVEGMNSLVGYGVSSDSDSDGDVNNGRAG